MGEALIGSRLRVGAGEALIVLPWHAPAPPGSRGLRAVELLQRLPRLLAEAEGRSALLGVLAALAGPFCTDLERRLGGACAPRGGARAERPGQHDPVRSALEQAIESGRLIGYVLEGLDGGGGAGAGGGPGGGVEPPWLETPPEAPPGTGKPGKDEELTWYEVRVVDELGEPIAGAALAVEVAGARHALLTDGDGRARIDGVYPSSGHARLEDLAALRAELRPRWDGVRPGPWLLDEPDTSLVPLRGSDPIVRNIFSETLHTIVLQPWVVRARLDGLLFDTNKSFLLPAAVDAPLGVEPPVSELRGWLADHPHSHCLVVGHTDTTGDPWYNDPLSLERADSFIAYLRGDVDHWLAWYGWDRPSEKRWGGAEDRMMLQAIAKRAGQPLISGLVEWYQQKRGLDVDGVIGTNTRRALVEDYMALQDRARPLPDLLLSHGCGESFPRTVKPDEGGVDGQLVEADDAAQRRVELFLFDASLTVQPPAPGAISRPGTQAYPEWVRRARRTEELSVASYHVLSLRLCSSEYESFPRAYVLLEAPLIELRADDDGIVAIPFEKGELSRVVRWTPEDAPDERYQTTVYFEFADDDEGARRKLHNLGYPRSLSVHDAVCRFQEEFDRPVTGNLDEIRDELHGWHDHGAPPFVLSGGGPAQPPGVSPAKGGGTSKATVVPTGPFALTVGVLLGGQPPEPAGVAVVLTPVGGATIGGSPDLHVGSLGSDGQVVFDKLSADGAFELRVGLEQAHAGGTLSCNEVQTIHTVGRRGHIITGARLPLVTVHPKSPVLGQGVQRKVSATVVHQDPPNVSWFGSNGIGVVESAAHHATVEGVTTSPQASHALLVARQTGETGVAQATKTGKVTVAARLGEHRVAMTVAEVQSVSCVLVATPPLPEHAGYDEEKRDHAVLGNDTTPKYHDENSLFVVLRGTKEPLQLTAAVKPQGTAVVWRVERNPEDHNAVDGLPTLTPSGAKAAMKMDQTGTFFVSARIEAISAESPAPRGLTIAMVEVRDVTKPSVSVYPERWRAYADWNMRGVDTGLAQEGAMRVEATALLVGGGPDGRVGTGYQSGRRMVELGWVNNVTSSDLVARYSGDHAVEVWFTPDEHPPPRVHRPGDLPAVPARVKPPIVDCEAPGAGGAAAALSQHETADQSPQPAIGRAVTVSAWDAPLWEVYHDFFALSQSETGFLKTIRMSYQFRCFLCAWTRNLSLSGTGREAGPYTFMAFAEFYWWVTGEYDLTTYKPLNENPKTGKSGESLIVPKDAAEAHCEVWPPGTLLHATHVLDPS